MTSNRIMKLEEWGSSAMYRASSDCNDKRCDITIDIETDKEFESIFINFYKDIYWVSNWTSNDNWFLDKWIRIKAAIRMLFTGYIKMESEFIMREDQVEDFINTINEGKEKIRDYMEENK